MIKTALFVRLEAKAGKEAEVETFLRGGLPLVMEEPATIAWFGIRLARPRSVFLTLFRMKRDDRRIFQEKLRPH